MIALDEALRPTWLFGNTVHEGCDRGGYYEQAQFGEEYGSPLCIVKLGCWGPVVQCNVGKRGWMGGVGGCPNVGGICIGCTMPGFPEVHAIHESTAGRYVIQRCTDLRARYPRCEGLRRPL
jgi:hydrogenase small subunit